MADFHKGDIVQNRENQPHPFPALYRERHLLTERTALTMAKRLISVCGECSNYNWKKHKCMVCSCKESDPRNPFYDDCPLPEGAEIVRCKDCKYWYDPICIVHSGWPDQYSTGHTVYMEPDDFCSYGERSGTLPQREDV